jgi:hypothetical protein
MSEINIPDPWGKKPGISVDDGGGSSFSSGYDTNTLTITGPSSLTISQPQYVGCWEISGNFYVYVIKKPSWLHRKMTKFLLGWIWKDS